MLSNLLHKMAPQELVDQYMEVLFSGRDLDRLREVFHPDLYFEGPLTTFHSAEEYINDLKSAPPVDFSYEIVNSFFLGSKVCLHYLFRKPGIHTTMIQIFEIEEGQIKRINLYFDDGLFG